MTGERSAERSDTMEDTMKRWLLLARASLLASLPIWAGCPGATEVRLSADRTTISAGGLEAATITAEALVGGSPVKSGTTINFITTAGSFDQGGTLDSTDQAADGNGRAQVKLYSGLTQGSATVTASFTDNDSGLSATSSLSITFGPPSGSQTPVDGTFRMTCDAVNIGALREPVPDIKLPCQISALTRSGGLIKASALSPEFMTEAGSLAMHTDSWTGERVLLFSPKGGDSAPRDVPPDSGLNEPSYLDKNGRQRNPRDGLCTLVAVVTGEEAFTDTNGNGSYDQGESFVDAAEPFVDMNDNDQWDTGEKYMDLDGNGRWDAANGKWDAQTKIMAIYKVLWTGALDSSSKTSRIERTSSSIAKGGKLELTSYALDANLNPVAAFPGNSDYLEWTLTSGGDATSNDSTTPPLDNLLGFAFDKAATTERKRWKILANSFTPKGYHFTVEDSSPTDTDPPTDFTVSVQVHVSPGPTGDGSYLGQLTEIIADKVQGKCD
jgi:hypothetical protein